MPLRLALYSDLHLEFGAPFEPPAALGADVVILAGDIMTPGHRAPAWARWTFGDRPVVFVPGNHEHYHQELQTAEASMRAACKEHDVHWLQAASAVIQGVRFLGCTLWTDLRLPILDRATGTLQSDAGRALNAALDRLADFDAIGFQRRYPPSAVSGPRGGHPPFRPRDMVRLHHAHRRWLAAELARPFDGPTVVVTHHAPSLQSVVERWRDDVLSACYASQLPQRFFRVPVLWVHGHTHTSHDYRIGRCRVVCNPRGYPAFTDGGPVRFQNRAWSEQGCGLVV